jgi:hypothetical protein
MAKAPVLKTGGRKPLQVRILCPPSRGPKSIRNLYLHAGTSSGVAAVAGAAGVTTPP